MQKGRMTRIQGRNNQQRYINTKDAKDTKKNHSEDLTSASLVSFVSDRPCEHQAATSSESPRVRWA